MCFTVRDAHSYRLRYSNIVVPRISAPALFTGPATGHAKPGLTFQPLTGEASVPADDTGQKQSCPGRLFLCLQNPVQLRIKALSLITPERLTMCFGSGDARI